MKITIEVDRWDFEEHFEDFYEKIRETRQMKNGRAVDRKEIRQLWKDRLKWVATMLLEENWDDHMESDVEEIVTRMDAVADQKLYKMVKEFQPA